MIAWNSFSNTDFKNEIRSFYHIILLNRKDSHGLRWPKSFEKYVVLGRLTIARALLVSLPLNSNNLGLIRITFWISRQSQVGFYPKIWALRGFSATWLSDKIYEYTYTLVTSSQTFLGIVFDGKYCLKVLGLYLTTSCILGSLCHIERLCIVTFFIEVKSSWHMVC